MTDRPRPSPPDPDKFRWNEVVTYLVNTHFYDQRVAWLAGDVLVYGKTLSQVWPDDVSEVSHAVTFARRAGLGGDAA